MRRNNRANNQLTGWIRSRELVILARPLAILFALLFSLTVHINASLAAGGNSALCLSVLSIAQNSDSTPSQNFQLKHCGVCTVSTSKSQLGMPPVVAFYDKNPGALFLFSPRGEIIFARISTRSNIRAPPFSVFNNS